MLATIVKMDVNGKDVWVNCCNSMKSECKYDELWFRINLHENRISLRKIFEWSDAKQVLSGVVNEYQYNSIDKLCLSYNFFFILGV